MGGGEGREDGRGEEYWKERKGEKMGRMRTEDGRGEYSIRYSIMYNSICTYNIIYNI
jgi:hypothetical protein